MRTGRVVAVVAAAVGACLEACHKDATGLTPNDVAGHYVAATFTTTQAGTWTLAADTVTLTHAANTFLRDMPLRVTGARLAGDKAFSGVQIVVVLQKQ